LEEKPHAEDMLAIGVGIDDNKIYCGSKIVYIEEMKILGVYFGELNKYTKEPEGRGIFYTNPIF
jgi:hypothetical protein